MSDVITEASGYKRLAYVESEGDAVEVSHYEPEPGEHYETAQEASDGS